MTEIFETVFVLSLIGSAMTALLLAIKPVTVKRFPAKWQYYAWILVMLAMVLPFYRLIPEKEAERLSFSYPSQRAEQNFYAGVENISQIPITGEVMPKEAAIEMENTQEVNEISLIQAVSCIWLLGTSLYLAVVAVSYIIFLLKKRKISAELKDNVIFARVMADLKIRRRIRLRVTTDIKSPMLVGVMFPVVYIPCRELEKENMEMVFLHELTHYKRKDLIIKWFAVLAGAIHWFNPFAYFMLKNVGEACELSCDMAVTKNMSDEEQKIYMKTILELG